MCGFAGIYNYRGLNQSNHSISAALNRMINSIEHRGPDSEGIFLAPRLALGHKRLKIQDLSDAGRQPMHLKNHGLTIVFNGEIYNYKELKKNLNALDNVVWISSSDTEVILHTYAKWGLQGLKKLEGMFSLALWDSNKSRLVLMRDRLGIKPLFYGECSFGFAFGSEIKSILAAGGVDTGLNDQAFSEYLWYGNSYESRTFYKGVKVLEPGHWLILENELKTYEAWWRVEEWLGHKSHFHSLEDASCELRHILDTAVSRQLIADVPISIFLSGGIDSSSIAASIRPSDRTSVHSYACGFDYDQVGNELAKARQVADHLSLNHSEFHISTQGLVDIVTALARAHDEPFADAANIPLYLMCKNLSNNSKVVLQGDGGDELFAGYRRYNLLDNIGSWQLWSKLLSPSIAKAVLGGHGHRFTRIAESVCQSNAALRMASLLTVETSQFLPEQIFKNDYKCHLLHSTDPILAYRHAANRFEGYQPLDQMLLTDLTVQLPSQFLTKVDRATMAAGIEARVPLLDEQVVKFALSIPSSWKVKRLQKKLILRKSQKYRLPRMILNAPKQGFGVPYAYWLCTSLYEFACSHIYEPSFIRKFDIDVRFVENLMNELAVSNQRRGFLVWKLFQLALWNNTQPAP